MPVPPEGIWVRIHQRPTEWIVDGHDFRVGRGPTLLEAWEDFLQDREEWIARCKKFQEELRATYDTNAEEAPKGDSGQEAPSNQVPESD